MSFQGGYILSKKQYRPPGQSGTSPRPQAAAGMDEPVAAARAGLGPGPLPPSEGSVFGPDGPARRPSHYPVV